MKSIPGPSRAIKHFSLHQINSTELRVVADVEEGVLRLIQEEETVLRGYARTNYWPHSCVTLFVLENLQPLIRQLNLGASPLSLPSSGQTFTPTDLVILNERPMVNIYDLEDLSNINIFVNRSEMVKQGYWTDPQILRGLLAHEHAHPLAENETTRACRQLRIQLVEEVSPNDSLGNRRPKMIELLRLLSEKLILLAPRELLANQWTIQNGFYKDLLYLNARNMENARLAIEGRSILIRKLQAEVDQGQLTPNGKDLLLFVGDLNSYLPLAMEVAPFYRTDQTDFARSLQMSLESHVFPFIDPMAVQCFSALIDNYGLLSIPITLPQFAAWSNTVLEFLFSALARKGLSLHFQLLTTEK